MSELEFSELGTKDYWDKRYATEMRSFESAGDPGEVWFEHIIDKIIEWIKTNQLINKQSKIVDVGCGNGMFLLDLNREDYENLHGLDYSENAIKLSKMVAEKYELNIQYKVCDVLEGLGGCFDVVHDKGTYDAVSLSEAPAENRLKYIQSVWSSLSDDGFFIITSCNWTQSELDGQFQGKFERLHVIPTPQFRFAGKVGSVLTCSVYKKLK